MVVNQPWLYSTCTFNFLLILLRKTMHRINCYLIKTDAMKSKKWTLKDIPDLTGKVIIVTGGNSGLGFESVKAFAQNGAKVILASRSLENGERAKKEIGSNQGNIEVMHLDLEDLNSVKNFANNFLVKYNRLDVLLNNAGIMMAPYFTTKDGLEGQNGINHFAHFALTGLLFNRIKETPGSRVVNVSSAAHKWGTMDFTNFLFEGGKGYSPTKSYGRSKLSNLHFTYELQRLFETYNVNSISVAAHPGASRTNLMRHIDGKFLFKVFTPLFKLITQDQAQGALPQIRASVDPQVSGGEYYGPGGFNEMKGSPVLVQSNAASLKETDSKLLWKLSEEITRISFSWESKSSVDAA